MWKSTTKSQFVSQILFFTAHVDNENIEALFAKINQLGGAGGSLDTAAMDERYAMKISPDFTINRIEALEAQLDMSFDKNDKSGDLNNMSFRSNTGRSNTGNLDLQRRVKELENGQADHTRRIEELEKLTKDLQEAMTGGNDDGDGNAAPTDTQLRNKVNLLEKSMAHKADKTEV